MLMIKNSTTAICLIYIALKANLTKVSKRNRVFTIYLHSVFDSKWWLLVNYTLFLHTRQYFDYQLPRYIQMTRAVAQIHNKVLPMTDGSNDLNTSKHSSGNTLVTIFSSFPISTVIFTYLWVLWIDYDCSETRHIVGCQVGEL